MGKTARWLSHPYLPLALAALAMALALPCLRAGLFLDDFLHRIVFLKAPALDGWFGPPLSSMFTFTDGNPERTRQLMDMGLFPWWTLDKGEFNFWRPMAAIIHWLDYVLWPDQPWLMHLHSLIWLGALVIAVTLLYRRFLGSGWVAGLAALLYAIDDAHAIPAVWIANRNALIGVFFGVVTILLHDRWRRDGQLPAAILAPLCFGLGILSNEGTIAVCAYLFAYSLFIDRGRWGARALTLAPYAILVVTWRIYYQLEGYGAWGSYSYIDPGASPLRFLKALLVREPVLLLSQWALPPAHVFQHMGPTGQFIMWIGAAAFLTGLFILLTPLLRQNVTARFWCLGMVLALVPSCAVAPMDRMLLFSGLGAMGLLAQFMTSFSTDGLSLPVPSVRQIMRRILCVLFIVVHLVLAPILLPLRITGYGALGNFYTGANESAELDDRVTDQTVLAVNMPNYPFTYLPIMRALKGQPLPAHTHSLAPNTLVQMRVSRPDESSLAVEPEGGFPWWLFRDGEHAFALGERVELTGMTVEVTKLAEEGWPLEVVYRFAVPLEHPSLVWLELQNGALVPFTPPAVGESHVLND